MINRLALATILLVTTILVSCNSADEQDALAKAQKCLDEVPQSNPPAAEDCMHHIDKYTGQQASIIKCSIKMVSGGLMENKVLRAFDALENDSITNKEAAFMAVMSLDRPNLTAGLAKAQEANVYCQESGVPGLMYLANVIVAGTGIAKIVSDLGGTLTENSTPAEIQAAMNAMLADCTGATPSASCSTNLAVVGTAVATLSTQYCATGDADEGVCKKVNDATAAAGTNATNIGQALLCYMNNKTFNPSTGLCN
jgi:hypothetical protein